MLKIKVSRSEHLYAVGPWVGTGAWIYHRSRVTLTGWPEAKALTEAGIDFDSPRYVSTLDREGTPPKIESVLGAFKTATTRALTGSPVRLRKGRYCYAALLPHGDTDVEDHPVWINETFVDPGFLDYYATVSDGKVKPLRAVYVKDRSGELCGLVMPARTESAENAILAVADLLRTKAPA